MEKKDFWLFSKIETIIEKTVQVFVLFAIILMVLLVFINVILRYIFNSGIPVSEEIARFLFIWTIFLGIILAFKDNEHLGVTLVVDALHGIWKKILLILGNLLTSVAIVILVISSITFTKIANTYTTQASGIPFGLVVSCSAIAAISILVLNVVKLFRILKMRQEDKA